MASKSQADSLPKPGLSFAEASVIRGSAEYLATKLSGRGLSCPHFPKYRVEDKKSPYPGRLGFFHLTDANFSYLDTSKLCAGCCADVVPNGFKALSIFTKISTADGPKATPAGQPPATALSRGWLDVPPSSESYPRAFQAGTEGFGDVPTKKRSRFARDTATVIAKVIAPDPVIIPMPRIAEAKEAWEWLEAQRVPFYIDQLHLTREWSPLVEKNAAMDAAIAAEIGSQFDLTTTIKSKKLISATEPKKTAKATKTKKPSLKDLAAGPAQTADGSQSPSATKQKIINTKELVVSPVEMAADSQAGRKVS